MNPSIPDRVKSKVMKSYYVMMGGPGEIASNSDLFSGGKTLNRAYIRSWAPLVRSERPPCDSTNGKGSEFRVKGEIDKQFAGVPLNPDILGEILNYFSKHVKSDLGVFVDLGSGLGNVAAAAVSTGVFSHGMGIENATHVETGLPLAHYAHTRAFVHLDGRYARNLFFYDADISERLISTLCAPFSKDSKNCVFVYATGMDKKVYEAILRGIRKCGSITHVVVVDIGEEKKIPAKIHKAVKYLDDDFTEIKTFKGPEPFTPYVQVSDPSDQTSYWDTSKGVDEKVAVVMRQIEEYERDVFREKTVRAVVLEREALLSDLLHEKIVKPGKNSGINVPALLNVGGLAPRDVETIALMDAHVKYSKISLVHNYIMSAASNIPGFKAMFVKVPIYGQQKPANTQFVEMKDEISRLSEFITEYQTKTSYRLPKKAARSKKSSQSVKVDRKNDRENDRERILKPGEVGFLAQELARLGDVELAENIRSKGNNNYASVADAKAMDEAGKFGILDKWVKAKSNF